MDRIEELHFALQDELTPDQMMMVSELLAEVTNVPIQARILASDWECPGCGWPWPGDDA
jgi:hypothetical protein